MRSATLNMKDKLVGIFLVLIGLELAFGQNGYKNFKWGESVESVRSKAGELSDVPCGWSILRGYYDA